MKEEKEDFFETIPEDKPEKKKEPKIPPLKPDDPLYYEGEESKWEHLMPSPYRKNRLIAWGVALIVVVAVLWAVYLYLFTPAVSEAVTYGYVEDIRKEGMLFKSYEGTILPYKSLMDTVKPYEGDFIFSTPDVEIATRLKMDEATGTPVRVEYEIYRTRMPWRGKEKIIVVKVDSVPDPSVLIPPR